MGNGYNYYELYLSLIIWLIIVLTPVGQWMESSMLIHILVQIPVLILIGFVICNAAKKKIPSLLNVISGGEIPIILVAVFVLLFWMIPRWLDASLTNDIVGFAKYISLPLGVGVPLAWCWNSLHFIARGVLKIEFLSMLFRLGWLYIISPDRLCNSYLINEQIVLGKSFLIIAISLSIFWLVPLFCGSKTDFNLCSNDIISEK